MITRLPAPGAKYDEQNEAAHRRLVEQALSQLSASRPEVTGPSVGGGGTSGKIPIWGIGGAILGDSSMSEAAGVINFGARPTVGAQTLAYVSELFTTTTGDARYVQLANFNTLGDARYLKLAGGTLTGAVTMSGSGGAYFVNDRVTPAHQFAFYATGDKGILWSGVGIDALTVDYATGLVTATHGLTGTTAEFSGSITLPNGVNLYGRRSTGNVQVGLLRYDSGTDDISMVLGGTNMRWRDTGSGVPMLLTSNGTLTLANAIIAPTYYLDGVNTSLSTATRSIYGVEFLYLGAAPRLRIGSLLVSAAYSNDNNVPTNGIFADGAIVGGGYLRSFGTYGWVVGELAGVARVRYGASAASVFDFITTAGGYAAIYALKIVTAATNLFVANAESMVMQPASVGGSSYMTWYDSTSTTRRAYLGLGAGSGSTADLYVNSDSGRVMIQANAGTPIASFGTAAGLLSSYKIQAPQFVDTITGANLVPIIVSGSAPSGTAPVGTLWIRF